MVSDRGVFNKVEAPCQKRYNVLYSQKMWKVCEMLMLDSSECLSILVMCPLEEICDNWESVLQNVSFSVPV